MSIAVVSGALMASSMGVVSAQIVPETSGQTSAANSPAAVVQTGSRRRLSCKGCARPSPEAGRPRVEAWLHEAIGSDPRRPAHLR
ncbi:hypothetical protein [uncultured Methylobacterium sp.]|uniref:hypothetical protein n=1 Tax=uncultured Methylobacterium sp. TaxID=157278 RepID=UPI0035CB8282